MKKLEPFEFFCAMLEIPSSVHIEIEILNENETGFVAYMAQHTNDFYVLSFERAIYENADPLYYIETLAHELVHVSQYITKKMVDGPFNIVYWKGQAIDCEATAYSDFPWEIEAFAMQEQLTLDYLAYRDSIQ